ncbi:MAG: chorion class high-cysteine HCB protein 13 [Clostridiales bacterium]|nr:chorion class high-cysteine HCB protein 13 [Clostridiales bacterium]
MSDLTATNCGCGCDAPNTGNSGGCNLIWLLFLLCICGGNGSICGGNNGCGCGNFFSGENNSCLFIILLLCCCGNGCF